MPAIDHPLIDQFLDTLWLEKGLSDNTRDAYRSDLALFNGWLQEKISELINAGRELILDHLAWRLEQLQATLHREISLRGAWLLSLSAAGKADQRRPDVARRHACNWAGRCPNRYRKPMSKRCSRHRT